VRLEDGDRPQERGNGLVRRRLGEHRQHAPGRVPPLLLGELELGERVAARRDGFRRDQEDEEVALLDGGAYPRIERLARRQRGAVAKHGVAFPLERELDARGRLIQPVLRHRARPRSRPPAM
jgi:hypothetical protein